MRAFAAALVLFLLASSAAVAAPPNEALSDPAQEARAQSLFGEFRCLVCQNQSIAESRADLARDLRMLVRERIVAGDSDAAIRDYLTARYGDFVLLKPPVKPSTWLLWFGPLLLLLAGAAATAANSRVMRGVSRDRSSTMPSTSPIAPTQKIFCSAAVGGRAGRPSTRP